MKNLQPSKTQAVSGGRSLGHTAMIQGGIVRPRFEPLEHEECVPFGECSIDSAAIAAPFAMPIAPLDFIAPTWMNLQFPAFPIVETMPIAETQSDSENIAAVDSNQSNADASAINGGDAAGDSASSSAGCSAGDSGCSDGG